LPISSVQMEMFCLKELPLVLEFSYILHKIPISKEKSLSAKNEHQQPFHIVVSHNTPTMFLSGLHLTPQPSCSNRFSTRGSPSSGKRTDLPLFLIQKLDTYSFLFRMRSFCAMSPALFSTFTTMNGRTRCLPRPVY
jgi:hypothetical protein